MNSPKACSSPTYKNIKMKNSQSPIELKVKMRKDYKNKVQNCRNMLLNRFRGAPENDLKMTLTDIYNKTFSNSCVEYKIQNDFLTDLDEIKILEEIKQELIQEELNWWIEEYERSQGENFDWSLMQKDDSVICFICQKNNFMLNDKKLCCKFCNIDIKTNLTLQDIKKSINEKLEQHSTMCSHNVQFTVVESHIYFMCENCMDMQVVV
ncbi:unnamed protein product, partial [Brenthis ino]